MNAYRKPPPPKPTTPEQGAALIRGLAIDLFDKRDGTGADWLLMVESIFKAGFQVADAQLEPVARSKLMRRIHAGSYERMTDAGTMESDPGEAIQAPSNAEPSKSNSMDAPK